MKYFKSLNCCLCNLPFVPIANQPRSPRALECGLGMCHECFEKEKTLKQEERKHQCSDSDDCLDNPNFAYFLIGLDVLSQDFITLLPTKSVYILTRPNPRIECPICYEEYSLTKSGKAPYDLFCNHTICDRCFSTIKKWDAEEEMYVVACPTCQKLTLTIETTRNNALKEFLRNLPRMTKQYVQLKISIERCSGCNIVHHIERMYNCSDCSAKLCGTCACRHHSHRVDDLVSMEANLISNKVKEVTTIQIGRYEEMFPELPNEFKKIINHLKTKLIDKADEIKKLVKIQEVHKEQQEIKELGEKFEAISEEYMPQFREFNSKLKNLLGQLENRRVDRPREPKDSGKATIFCLSFSFLIPFLISFIVSFVYF